MLQISTYFYILQHQFKIYSHKYSYCGKVFSARQIASTYAVFCPVKRVMDVLVTPIYSYYFPSKYIYNHLHGEHETLSATFPKSYLAKGVNVLIKAAAEYKLSNGNN